VSLLEKDQVLSQGIEKLVRLIRSGVIINEMEKTAGSLKWRPSRLPSETVPNAIGLGRHSHVRCSFQ
jgi:hypothetical protein